MLRAYFVFVFVFCLARVLEAPPLTHSSFAPSPLLTRARSSCRAPAVTRARPSFTRSSTHSNDPVTDARGFTIHNTRGRGRSQLRKPRSGPPTAGLLHCSTCAARWTCARTEHGPRDSLPSKRPSRPPRHCAAPRETGPPPPRSPCPSKMRTLRVRVGVPCARSRRVPQCVTRATNVGRTPIPYTPGTQQHTRTRTHNARRVPQQIGVPTLLHAHVTRRRARVEGVARFGWHPTPHIFNKPVLGVTKPPQPQKIVGASVTPPPAHLGPWNLAGIAHTRAHDPRALVTARVAARPSRARANDRGPGTLRLAVPRTGRTHCGGASAPCPRSARRGRLVAETARWTRRTPRKKTGTRCHGREHQPRWLTRHARATCCAAE